MSEEPDGQRNVTTWPTMATKVIKVDEDKIRDCKEDIDTLMVFAGLFSAVTSAFLIESYKNLQQDQSDTTNMLLAQLLLQQTTTGTTPIDPSSLSCIAASSCEGFNPPLSAIRVNILWFASLILSLVTASFGMLVKQWLREFLAGEYTSPRARLRTHLFRYPGLIQWGVFELVAILPLLLQLSLALFFFGLFFFTWSIHSATVGLTTLILVALWVLLFVAATLSPILSPRCPYKTTFVKHIMKILRRFVARVSTRMLTRYQRLSKFDAKDIEKSTMRDTPENYEEEYFAKNAVWEDDLEILLAVDTMQVDDELFCNIIASLVKQKPHSSDPQSPVEKIVMNFITKFIENRSEMRLNLSSRPVLYGSFSLNVWTAIVEIVADVVIEGASTSTFLTNSYRDSWTENAVTLLLSLTDYDLPAKGANALARAFEASPKRMARLVTMRTPLPTWVFDETKLIGPRLETDVLAELLMREIRGVLKSLRGKALLTCLLELIRHRFDVQTASILDFFQKHLPGIKWTQCPSNTPGQPITFHISSNGCLKHTLQLLIDDIDRTFVEPCIEMTPSIKEACSIIFTCRSSWTDDQRRQVTSWLMSRQSLDWCFMLAFTLEEDPATKELGTVVRDALLDLGQKLNFRELHVMVNDAIEIMRSRGIARAFSLTNQDSETCFDCLYLCEFLLKTLISMLSKPQPTGKKDLKDCIGLLHTLKRLDQSLSNFLAVHNLISQCEMTKTCIDLCEEYNRIVIPRGETPGPLVNVIAALNRKTTFERAVELLKRSLSPPQSPNQSPG